MFQVAPSILRITGPVQNATMKLISPNELARVSGPVVRAARQRIRIPFRDGIPRDTSASLICLYNPAPENPLTQSPDDFGKAPDSSETRAVLNGYRARLMNGEKGTIVGQDGAASIVLLDRGITVFYATVSLTLLREVKNDDNKKIQRSSSNIDVKTPLRDADGTVDLIGNRDSNTRFSNSTSEVTRSAYIHLTKENSPLTTMSEDIFTDVPVFLPPLQVPTSVVRIPARIYPMLSPDPIWVQVRAAMRSYSFVIDGAVCIACNRNLFRMSMLSGFGDIGTLQGEKPLLYPSIAKTRELNYGAVSGVIPGRTSRISFPVIKSPEAQGGPSQYLTRNLPLRDSMPGESTIVDDYVGICPEPGAIGSSSGTDILSGLNVRTVPSFPAYGIQLEPSQPVRLTARQRNLPSQGASIMKTRVVIGIVPDTKIQNLPPVPRTRREDGEGW